jgi:two-component system, NarL family, nitrate/nitrite response regulator NarL
MKTTGFFSEAALATKRWTKSMERFPVRRNPGKAVYGKRAKALRTIRFTPKMPVLLIEDNYLLRDKIASMLRNNGDFEIIECGEVEETIRRMKVRKPRPRVALMNPGIEDGQGLKLAALLREELPETMAIMMDILPDRADTVEFVKAGVCGFILNDAREADYISTIKTVAEGTKVLPPILTGSLFTRIAECALERGKGTRDNLVPLTGREREIVRLISEGFGNKEIAARLHIATYTVKSHIHNILDKLGLNSRLQIAAFTRKRESVWPGKEYVTPDYGGGFVTAGSASKPLRSGEAAP